ncbi:phenoloxidase-activating factor 3-like [Bicyclus anynana]|uniref:Phenoloxidase-activating factor 3-like n=1 Tax=Bicyclus anynana TaxID=110368 RepID=A0ABM3LML8_BICAN|nr:phenoloxidase-activating factor 3-like [Bicyclus anynana]
MRFKNIQFFFWIIVLFASAITEDTNKDYEKSVNIDDYSSKLRNQEEQERKLEEDHSKLQASGDLKVCCSNSNKFENNSNGSEITPNSDEGKQIIKDLPFVNENILSRGDQCTNASRVPNPDTLCCGKNIYDLDETAIDKSETDVDMFPWLAFLISTFKQNKELSVFTCEGALISHRYVLTSASCVYSPGATLKTINVTLAKYGTDCGFQIMPDNPLEVYPECLLNLQVENVVYHEYFQYDNLLHDIALVRLRDNESTRSIAPVCLPTFNTDSRYADEPLVVIGWDLAGNVREALVLGVDENTFLKQASTVFHVSNFQCHKFYPFLSRSHICATSRKGEETLDGVTGSPLMMLYKEVYYVIGVFSAARYSTVLGEAVPSLYTDVYRHILWIKRNMKD